MITALQTTTGFSGAVDRYNAAGKSMGKRVVFLQDVPAGDIRKALRAADPSLKGKKLTERVDQVLRGDSTAAWACFEATVSAARSQGFVPLIADLSKRGNKLALKLERPSTSLDKATIIEGMTQLTDEELLAELERRKNMVPKARAVIDVKQ